MYCPWFSRNNSISGATSLKALRKESLSNRTWDLKRDFEWVHLNFFLKFHVMDGFDFCDIVHVKVGFIAFLKI